LSFNEIYNGGWVIIYNFLNSMLSFEKIVEYKKYPKECNMIETVNLLLFALVMYAAFIAFPSFIEKRHNAH